MSEEITVEAVIPILDAIDLGRTDIIKTLLDQVKETLIEKDDENAFKGFINFPHKKGDNFLQIAAKEGKQDIVLTLLQCGADPSRLDSDGKKLSVTCKDFQKVVYPVILGAVANSDHELVQQILEAGMNPNVTGSDKMTLLHWGASHSNPVTVQILVTNGANVNALDKDGVTPLHLSLDRKSEEVSTVLVNNGADLDSKATSGKFEGQSPLELIRSSDFHWSSDFLNILPLSNGHVDSDQDNIEEHYMQIAAHDLIQNETPLSSKELLDEVTNNVLNPLAPVITDERLNKIWPQPAFIKQLSGEPFQIPNELPLSISPGKESIHDILDVFETHRNRLRASNRKIFLSDQNPVKNHTNLDIKESIIHYSMRKSSSHTMGSYTIHVLKEKINITSGDLYGLHYALTTLIQMFCLFGEEGLVSCVIKDNPQCSVRAILFDMNSYGRIPIRDIFIQTIEILSYLKINQLQAFVRISNGPEWSFSYSKSDILSIDRFCKQHFIQFVPAIDVDASFNADELPSLVEKIQEIMSCFRRSDYIHIGPVLTSLMFKSFESVKCFDKLFSSIENVMICSNSIANHDIKCFPSNIIALQYGFKKNHNFTLAMNKVQDLGMEFGLCSGTAAWSNLAGSPVDMLSSIMSGHSALEKLRGQVSVTAHWSSDPSFSQSVFAFPGIVVAAGLAWNEETPLNYIECILEELLNVHVFGSQSIPWGKVILDLGKAENQLDEEIAKNCSTSLQGQQEESFLLKLLTTPDEVSFEHVSAESLGSTILQIRKIQSLLVEGISSSTPPSKSPKSSPYKRFQNERLEGLRHELQITIDIMLIAAKIGRALIQSGMTWHNFKKITIETVGNRIFDAAKMSMREAMKRIKARIVDIVVLILEGGLDFGMNPKLGVNNSTTSAELEVINVGISNLTPTFKTDLANKLLTLVEQYRALWLSRYLAPGLQGSLGTLNKLLQKLIPEGLSL